MAQKVAQVFDLEIYQDVLTRIRKTKPQVELSGKARKMNVKGAFKCIKPSLIKDKNILLIDDVCTTGATLEECGLELKKSGARQIWGLVLARQ